MIVYETTFCREPGQKEKKVKVGNPGRPEKDPGRLVGARAWIWPLAGCLMLSCASRWCNAHL